VGVPEKGIENVMKDGETEAVSLILAIGGDGS